MRPEEDVYDHTVTYKFSLFGNLVSRISRIKKMEDKRAMEKYNQKLKMYYRCMNRRDAWYANRPTAVRAITIERGGELNIKCFDW